MPEQKIEKCPYCGEGGNFVRSPKHPHIRVLEGEYQAVHCPNCDSWGPGYHSATKAIAAHNSLCQRLASAPALTRERDGLLEILRDMLILLKYWTTQGTTTNLSLADYGSRFIGAAADLQQRIDACREGKDAES